MGGGGSVGGVAWVEGHLATGQEAGKVSGGEGCAEGCGQQPGRSVRGELRPVRGLGHQLGRGMYREGG